MRSVYFRQSTNTGLCPDPASPVLAPVPSLTPAPGNGATAGFGPVLETAKKIPWTTVGLVLLAAVVIFKK